MLTESKVKLNPGDFILVYTDGVDEAANINKELFGADRLVQTLIQSADQSADQIVKSIDKAIRDFTRGAAQSDDITMILIKAET
jgi:sigma-B regulation protein RsbU (phosphoserine phosphatase)